MVKFYTAYDLDRDFDHLSVDYTDVESLTCHVDDDETDINQLVYRSRMRELSGESNAFYVDSSVLTGADDYHSAMNRICAVNDSFSELPSSLRNRFNNDPSQMLSFLEDPANIEEGVSLGLLDANDYPKKSPSDVDVNFGKTDNSKSDLSSSAEQSSSNSKSKSDLSSNDSENRTG